MDVIYAVTTFSKHKHCLPNGEEGYPYTDTVGWFPTVEKAIEAVERNDADIACLGMEIYAVIEQVPWGFYPIQVKEIAWYRWDEVESTYVQCVRPNDYVGEHVAHFFG